MQLLVDDIIVDNLIDFKEEVLLEQVDCIKKWYYNSHKSIERYKRKVSFACRTTEIGGGTKIIELGFITLSLVNRE